MLWTAALHEGSPVNWWALLKQLSRARASFVPLNALGAVRSISHYSACQQASLHNRPHLAAALAAAAVGFRQTNAVWAALILGSTVLRRTLGEDHRRWAGASAEAQLKYALRAALQARSDMRVCDVSSMV